MMNIFVCMTIITLLTKTIILLPTILCYNDKKVGSILCQKL